LTALHALFRRELGLAWSGGGAFLSVGFFAAITIMLPLGLGSSPSTLAPIAPGIAWIALVLASLLSLDRLFDRDLESGALDFIVSTGPPLEIVAAVKCIAQWLVCAVPLALISPLGALALGASPRGGPMLIAASLLGGLAFTFVGGAGAALALASRRGGILIALIVLPLLTAPVIFGGGAIARAAASEDWAASLALLGAYTLVALVATPFVMAGACRNALS
jgi:heme exporter protein B